MTVWLLFPPAFIASHESVRLEMITIMLQMGEIQLAHFHWNPTKGRKNTTPRPAASLPSPRTSFPFFLAFRASFMRFYYLENHTKFSTLIWLRPINTGEHICYQPFTLAPLIQVYKHKSGRDTSITARILLIHLYHVNTTAFSLESAEGLGW